MTGETPRQNPYKSALDLPSVAEMLEHIRGGKILTRVLARRLRPDLLRIEKSVRELAALVDAFYGLLGPRHWIFHEHLNTEKVAALLDLSADAAERGLIAMYQEPETLGLMIRMLRRFPQMRARFHLIERARRDYLEGRYYAAILVLLSVMDGFVNDLDPQHRGLHTRSDDEMHAWDSVVGHHLGLTNAHRTFTRSFSKTSEEEIHELYRNGIMHGNLVSFDNDVVATKAWNRLFAVADWAASRQKQADPSEPKPSLREIAAKIRLNKEAKKALAAWRPRVVRRNEPGFTDEQLYDLSAEYLSAWKTRNYGKMAVFLSALVMEDTHGKTAGMVRDGCIGFDLSEFSVEELIFEAAAVCEVAVDLVVGAEPQPARMRWIREGEDGRAALPNESGEWKLILWTPIAMINRARAHAD